MREHAVVPAPRPPVWHRPPAGPGPAARQAGAAQQLILAPGPWDAPGSLTAAPVGWFTVAVDARADGFRLGGHRFDVAAFADAIWQCPRWRGRPVLLVTQPNAPADGAGPALRGLAEALGAPVYASDAGLHFIFGRAVAERMFWCWRPGAEPEEPEPVGVVLPPPARRPAPKPAAAAPSPQRPAARQESDAPLPPAVPPAVPQPDAAVPRPLGVLQANVPAVQPLPDVPAPEPVLDVPAPEPLVAGDGGDVAKGQPLPDVPGEQVLLAGVGCDVAWGQPLMPHLPAQVPVAGSSGEVAEAQPLAALLPHLSGVQPLAVPLPDLSGVQPLAVPLPDLSGVQPLAVPQPDAAEVQPLPVGDDGDAGGLQALAVPVMRIGGFDLGVRQVRLEPSGAGEPDPGPRRAESPVTDDVAPPPKLPQQVESPEPAWFPVRAIPHEADRERVRAALGWKFQTYFRGVSRAMSLHPGLRSAGRTQDGGAGLVAVLALLDGSDARVNAGLRAAGTPDEQVQALARCAAAGLAHLPVVSGPVFAAAPDGVDLTRSYRPGDVLVEPAFTRVSMERGGGTGPSYAIWSATARRLDQLSGPDEAAGEAAGKAAGKGQAMFAAGARFEVLAVDQADPEGAAGGAPCVLLRELVFDRRDGDLSRRVAGRLRAVLKAPASPAASVTWPWPLGLVDGRRFPLDTGTGDGKPPAGGSHQPGGPEGAAS
ncbi:hypothetical protein AB0H83_08255 [Dactylosporangium sp. NPDC050688]|uniref:hypothetical protein n=1 Tax=Dactylosporangium sp. NPDC050688 TaxID=3157217 RepID=UPI0033E69FAD